MNAPSHESMTVQVNKRQVEDIHPQPQSSILSINHNSTPNPQSSHKKDKTFTSQCRDSRLPRWSRIPPPDEGHCHAPLMIGWSAPGRSRKSWENQITKVFLPAVENQISLNIFLLLCYRLRYGLDNKLLSIPYIPVSSFTQPSRATCQIPMALHVQKSIR